jgi:D-inositol-3-phosphate glycosyltransferase
VALVVWHSSPTAAPGHGWAGGMNVYARAMAIELADQGVAVDLWTATDASVPRIRPRPVPGHPLLRTIEVPRDWVTSRAPASADFERLEHRLRAHGLPAVGPYEVVHAHYWRSVPLATGIAERHGAPLFYTFHTIGWVRDRHRLGHEPLQPPERAAYEGRAVHDAEGVIVSCASEERELVSLYGDRLRRVCTVAPGVDRGVFSHDRPAQRDRTRGSEVVLLAVSRIDPVKGLDLAIEAGSSLARSLGRAVRLVIAGGPSGHAGPGEMRRLRAVADAARATGGRRFRVSFVGPRDRATVARLYRRADVTLVSSYSESCGLVTLESLACGTPVVGTEVGVIPEVVHDEVNGHVVQSRDAEEFAGRIGALLAGSDPERVRCAALETAQGYSWRLAAARLGHLYGSDRRALSAL